VTRRSGESDKTKRDARKSWGEDFRGERQGWIRMSGNPNYPYSYPLKMLIWISVFVFVFNMDVRWMYSNPIFNIIRIRHYPNYSTKIRHILHYLYPQK
jgi:hypothetical protein